jgi:thymidylate synthase (FAD)
LKIVDMSVELLDSMGSDNAVADAARVSFHKEASNYTDEQNQRLISYLARHNHWTPFAHCFLKYRIKAPVFVARQMVKHQVGLAWNEVSRRYVDEEPEFWFPKVWRKRAENVKQGSSDEEFRGYIVHEFGKDVPDELQWGVDEGTEILPQYLGNILVLYKGMIHAGVAPEQARMILPQNTMTEWIWSGSLAAFARVCKLRLDPHAQKETQAIAQMINDQVPKDFEHSWAALLA